MLVWPLVVDTQNVESGPLTRNSAGGGEPRVAEDEHAPTRVDAPRATKAPSAPRGDAGIVANIVRRKAGPPLPLAALHSVSKRRVDFGSCAYLFFHSHSLPPARPLQNTQKRQTMSRKRRLGLWACRHRLRLHQPQRHRASRQTRLPRGRSERSMSTDGRRRVGSAWRSSLPRRIQRKSMRSSST